MKKYLNLVLLALFAIGCSYAQTRETRDVDDFTGIAFAVAGELILEQGSTFSVILEGDEDFLEEIETRVRDNRLLIRHDRWFSFRDKKVTVYVTMPEVESLSVSGSGKMIAEGSIRADNIHMGVSGSGDIVLKELNAESINCGISGSGTITLNGEAEDGELSISGSGNYEGQSFQLETLDVSISGSGTCRTAVGEDLEARVSGSGDVYYTGNPRVDARVSGSGKVRKN